MLTRPDCFRFRPPTVTCAFKRCSQATIGSDALGLNLPRLCQQVGLVEPGMAFIHPVYLRGEQKRLWEYSFFAASPHFVGSGLISDPELKRLSVELKAVAADETISVHRGAAENAARRCGRSSRASSETAELPGAQLVSGMLAEAVSQGRV